MDAAWQSVCVCPVALGLGLANDLLGSVNWHDSTERLRKNRKETIGAFAKCLYFANFADRKDNLFAIGIKGSGETTVLSAFRNILPEDRVFTPIYDSGAPFAKLRERHILGNFQEFRCRTTIAASTSLQWTERQRNLYVDVKHDDGILLPHGGPRCIFSSNYLTKCPGWNDEDIEAPYDRGETFWWNRELPVEKRKQAARSTCKRRSVTFLAWRSPELLQHLENKFGPLPQSQKY